MRGTVFRDFYIRGFQGAVTFQDLLHSPKECYSSQKYSVFLKHSLAKEREVGPLEVRRENTREYLDEALGRKRKSPIHLANSSQAPPLFHQTSEELVYCI